MMRSDISSGFVLLLPVVAALCLYGCITTYRFGYSHPSQSGPIMVVSLSKSSDDVFRVIIDNEFILQRKLSLDRRGDRGWDMASGMFAGVPVVLSCTREYSGSPPGTFCDFSIGSGEHVKIKVY